MLTDNQTQQQVNACCEFQEQTQDNLTLLSTIITEHETWVYEYEPKTKQHSLQWKSPSSPCPKTARQVPSYVQQKCNFFSY
jgi:hypothetical protein